MTRLSRNQTTTHRSWWQKPCLALAATLLAGTALASDEVTDAIQLAYAPYRTALFATNQKSVPEAKLAMEKALTAWRAVSGQFSERVPAPYDRDKAFQDSLKRVLAVYNVAEQQVSAGQLPQAHETLEEARDVVAALRSRNGVVVYSDHMNDYHEHMEGLLASGLKPLAQPGGWMTLAKHVGVLEYLAQRLKAQAPQALSAQAEFASLLQAVLQASANLGKAVQEQDEAKAGDALAKLKGPYSRLFLKFG